MTGKSSLLRKYGFVQRFSVALLTGLMLWPLGGCTLPMLMKASASAKKPSQEHYSCGEDCPRGSKHTRRVKE